MKIFKKLGIICLALLLVCSTGFLVTACGNKRDWTKIELNEVTHSVFYAPLYVAINQGFFQNEGISVSLFNGGGSNVSMTALLTGSADIILAGPETVVYTQQEGVGDAPVVFGQLTTCDGSFIVSKTHIQDFSLENLKDKSIIGGRPGGMPAMTLQYILETNGYTIGDGAGEVHVRTDVDFNSTASVFMGDASIDFCALFEPVATNVVKQNSGYQNVASLGKLSGSIPYTCFAARGSYLKNHGDIAEKFVRAVTKAYNFIKTNNSTTVAQALLPSFVGNTLEEMKIAVEAYLAIDAWSEDLILSEESFANLMNVLIHAKAINHTSQWQDVVDNTIAEKIKAEI